MILRALCSAFTAIHLLGVFRTVVAQTSEATCLSSFNWADNSLGQSPCLVAAFLIRQCSSSEIDIPILPAGDHYDPGDTSACNCNTAVYSLISACADCQGRLFDTWTEWSVNCTNVYRGIFPYPIPSGTAVPAWAYLDVLSSNVYNATAARSDINAPESLPPGASSTPSIPSPTSTFSASTTAMPPPSGGSSHHVDVGPIAGGVVGGLAVIGLAAALITFLILRKKREGIPIDGYYDPPAVSELPLSPAPLSVYPHSPTPPKLYDPSDPSTFPDVFASQIPRTPLVDANPRNQYLGTPSPPPMGLTQYSGPPQV